MIFQGVRDASVDYRTVEAFAKTRPNVTLSLLEDDHQLIASLPRIWNDVQPFLGLTSEARPLPRSLGVVAAAGFGVQGAGFSGGFGVRRTWNPDRAPEPTRNPAP